MLDSMRKEEEMRREKKFIARLSIMRVNGHRKLELNKAQSQLSSLDFLLIWAKQR